MQARSAGCSSIKPQRGFTLIEMVMVITLAGTVAVMISSSLSRPLEGFVAQSRRAELVDLAAGALSRMTRDIRLAVPNSVRVNGSTSAASMEMLSVLSAGRYLPNRLGAEGLRFAPGVAPSCTASGGNCSAFQVLDPALSSASARWLVLYNIGSESGGTPVPGANVWAGPAADGSSVISPDGSSFSAAALGNQTLLTVTPPAGSFNFAYASPQRRFYLADQVVGYRCTGGQLLRFSRTARNPAYSGAGTPVANNVDCASTRFSYSPGSTQRGGVLSLSLRLTLSGESIELFQQVHVDNAP